MLALVSSLDISIINYINENFQFWFLNPIMITISRLGNAGIMWIAIALIFIVFKDKKLKTLGFLILCALLLNYILCDLIIKNIVARPRPYNTLNIDLLIPKLNSYSFPSGHTSSSFAACFILSKFFKKYSILFFSFAILMGISRIYLNMHYTTDVLAGIILGLLNGMVVFYCFKRSKFNRGIIS